MTPAIFLLVALAGGLGSVVRFIVDRSITARFGAAYPFGVSAINVTGSLALGFVTGLVVAHLIPNELYSVVGAGLLGGYTTFSTASLDTVRLVQARRYGAALANGLGMLVVSVAAAWLGYWLGTSREW